MRIIRAIWTWLVALFRRGVTPYVIVVCDDLPETLREKRLYVVGASPHFWKAALLCPCGCGDTIELNLAPPGRPRWELTQVNRSQVTVSPSVWRATGCGSHFWIREGKIVWCAADKNADRA